MHKLALLTALIATLTLPAVAQDAAATATYANDLQPRLNRRQAAKVRTREPGDSIELTVSTNGAQRVVEVTLETAPSN